MDVDSVVPQQQTFIQALRESQARMHQTRLGKRQGREDDKRNMTGQQQLQYEQRKTRKRQEGERIPLMPEPFPDDDLDGLYITHLSDIVEIRQEVPQPTVTNLIQQRTRAENMISNLKAGMFGGQQLQLAPQIKLDPEQNQVMSSMVPESQRDYMIGELSKPPPTGRITHNGKPLPSIITVKRTEQVRRIRRVREVNKRISSVHTYAMQLKEHLAKVNHSRRARPTMSVHYYQPLLEILDFEDEPPNFHQYFNPKSNQWFSFLKQRRLNGVVQNPPEKGIYMVQGAKLPSTPFSHRQIALQLYDANIKRDVLKHDPLIGGFVDQRIVMYSETVSKQEDLNFRVTEQYEYIPPMFAFIPSFDLGLSKWYCQNNDNWNAGSNAFSVIVDHVELIAKNYAINKEIYTSKRLKHFGRSLARMSVATRQCLIDMYSRLAPKVVELREEFERSNLLRDKIMRAKSFMKQFLLLEREVWEKKRKTGNMVDGTFETFFQFLTMLQAGTAHLNQWAFSEMQRVVLATIINADQPIKSIEYTQVVWLYCIVNIRSDWYTDDVLTDFKDLNIAMSFYDDQLRVMVDDQFHRLSNSQEMLKIHDHLTKVHYWTVFIQLINTAKDAFHKVRRSYTGFKMSIQKATIDNILKYKVVQLEDVEKYISFEEQVKVMNDEMPTFQHILSKWWEKNTTSLNLYDLGSGSNTLQTAEMFSLCPLNSFTFIDRIVEHNPQYHIPGARVTFLGQTDYNTFVENYQWSPMDIVFMKWSLSYNVDSQVIDMLKILSSARVNLLVLDSIQKDRQREEGEEIQDRTLPHWRQIFKLGGYKTTELHRFQPEGWETQSLLSLQPITVQSEIVIETEEDVEI